MQVKKLIALLEKYDPNSEVALVVDGVASDGVAGVFNGYIDYDENEPVEAKELERLAREEFIEPDFYAEIKSGGLKVFIE